MQLLGEDTGVGGGLCGHAMMTISAPSAVAASAAADPEGNEFGKLFVGGLSQVTNECSLRAYFGQYGAVEDAVVMMDNQTGRSRGFGFVKFKDTGRVGAVLEAAAGHVIDGKPVDVKQSNINVKGKTSRNLKIFVGGIAPEHDAGVVREFFSQYGRVTDVNLMLDQSKQRHRGFAFVAFEDERTVQHLVQMHFVDIGGRVVEIKAMKPPNFEARAAAAAAAAAAATVGNHSSAEPIYRTDFAATGCATTATAAAYPTVQAPLPNATAAAWPHSAFPYDPTTASFGWTSGALAWPGYYGQPTCAGGGPVGLLETWSPHLMPPPPPLPPPPQPTASAWTPAGWLPLAWPGLQQQQQPQQQPVWPNLLQQPPQTIAVPPPPLSTSVIQSLGCWDQSLQPWPRPSLQPMSQYQANPPDASSIDASDEGSYDPRHLPGSASPPLLPRYRRRPTAARGDPGLDSTGFSWLYPKEPPGGPLLAAAGIASAPTLSHVAAGDFDRCNGTDVGASFVRSP